jgi:hypothetical protein
VHAFYAAVAVTTVSRPRNLLNEYTQPVWVSEAKSVKEAVVNGTRDMIIEVVGCAVATPSAP